MKKKSFDSEKLSTNLAAYVTENHEINQPPAVCSGYIQFIQNQFKGGTPLTYARIRECLHTTLMTHGRIKKVLNKMQNIN